MNMLHNKVQNTIRRYGYKKFTPIQEKAIPFVLQGLNTLIIAPTGSGKTEAAFFPLFSLLISNSYQEDSLKVIYITPLRALNRDIYTRMRSLAESLGISFSVRHGDTSRTERRAFLDKPPAILITTPETFVFLLAMNRLREVFRNTKWIVIDEIHELMTSERGVELLLGIEQIHRMNRHKIQLIGLSATIPESLERELYTVFLRYGPTVVIRDSSRKDIDIKIELVAKENDTRDPRLRDIPEIISNAVPVIADYVKQNGVHLIFTNTRDTAEWIGSALNIYMESDCVRVHHGSLDKDTRIRAERELREGRIKALVATSSMELGIDIGHIDTVIQFGSPRQAIRLLQRVGRSKHRLELVSKGIIVIPETTIFETLESIVLARRTKNNDLEEINIPKRRYSPLTHQIIGILINNRVISIDELFDIVTSTLPYRDLSKEELVNLLEFLDQIGLARLDKEKRVVKIGRRSISYYFSTTMIPDESRYEVIDTVTRKRIGFVDKDFLITSLPAENTIILAGKTWRIISISEDKIFVEETKEDTGLPPIWTGELIPVYYKVAREVCAIIRRIIHGGNYFFLVKEYNVPESIAEKIATTILDYERRGSLLPTDKNVVVGITGNYLVVYACLGSRGCEALGMLLSMLIHETTGYRASYYSTPYYVLFYTPRPITLQEVRIILEKMRSPDIVKNLEKILKNTVRLSPLYRVKMVEIATKMGVIDKNILDYAKNISYSSLILKLRDTPVEKEVLRILYSEKLDISTLRDFLEKLRQNKLRLEVYQKNKPEDDPLLTDILTQHRQFMHSLAQTAPLNILIEIFKRRIEDREVRIACMLCGWSDVVKIKYLEDDIKCPRCGSRYLTALKPEDKETLRVIRKLIQGERKLSSTEREKVRHLQDIANLILSYGKKALIALSAIGVGPTIAKKILAKTSMSTKNLYVELMNAEKNYLRTRIYWDS